MARDTGPLIAGVGKGRLYLVAGVEREMMKRLTGKTKLNFSKEGLNFLVGMEICMLMMTHKRKEPSQVGVERGI